MAKKHRGLGSGVDALLSQSAQLGSPLSSTAATENYRLIPIDNIRPNRMQPRTQISQKSVAALAASIRRNGILQALVVRPDSDREGSFQLIAGERRWRAAMQAGLHEVPVVIRDSDDQSAASLALIENIQREDLTVLEKAVAVQRLITMFNLTHQNVAEQLGQSRSTITNLLRLLQLAPQAMEYLRNGQIEEGHARALLALPAEQQDPVAKEIVDKQMNVRQTEARVRLSSRKSSSKKPVAQKDANIEQLQRQLEEQLGTPVRVAHRADGRGEIIIHYADLDILDGVLAKIMPSK